MFERVLNILLLLSLGLLTGAILFFGLGVAGVLFNEELLASRTISGGLNARVLERLMVLVTATSIVALGSSIPLLFSRPRRTNGVTFIALVLALVLALYLSLDFFPEVDELRIRIGSFDPVLASKQELHARFTELHTRFSLLVRILFGLSVTGMVAHVLTLVSRARRTVVPGSAAASTTTQSEPEQPVGASIDA